MSQPQWHLTVATECTNGKGADSTPTEYVLVGSVGMFVAVKMGTLKTDFVDPILCGCVTVSKTWVGVESDRFGVVGIFCECIYGVYWWMLVLTYETVGSMRIWVMMMVTNACPWVGNSMGKPTTIQHSTWVYPSKWAFIHPKQSIIDWVMSKTIILLCFAYNPVNTKLFWMSKGSFWSLQVGESLPVPITCCIVVKMWLPLEFPVQTNTNR